MFRDAIIAAIRTGVATIVGVLITWLINVGVDVPDNFQQGLVVVLVGAITIGYNLLVGILERQVNPYFGFLLGIPKAPAYGQVGTQTPNPTKPLLGNPPVDRA